MSPLRIVALGGLGEVGMNCMCLEAEQRALLIDCGVTFPDKEPGVDIIHPRFDHVLERRDRLEAVVLTHGHEDHVGALPYLLSEVDVPVYGPPYALSLARERLAEQLPDYEPRLIPTAPRQAIQLGPFGVTPYQVAHSIPDAHGLILDTPAGRVVHSGDFKIDGERVSGPGFDEEHVRRVGQEGVELLLSDSTNVEVPGSAGGERPVAEALEARIAAAEQRLVVCMFASNVERLSAVLAAARKHRRRVLLLGRSLLGHSRIGEELGLLDDPPAHLVSLDDAADVPRGELLVIATGSQGEPAAALPRLAYGTHHKLELEAGDEVVLSARVIPGRERDVYSVISALERRGITVWTRNQDPALHVSGHAGRDEQRRLIEWLQPRSFVPIHGTLVHLRRHAALARATGVPDALVVENGSVLELDGSGVRVVDAATVGRVHRQGGNTVSGEVLTERGRLARHGVVVVALPLDAAGAPAGTPGVVAHGVAGAGDLEAIEKVVAAATGRALSRTKVDSEDALVRAVSRAVRRALYDDLGARPTVDVVLTRVDA